MAKSSGGFEGYLVWWLFKLSTYDLEPWTSAYVNWQMDSMRLDILKFLKIFWSHFLNLFETVKEGACTSDCTYEFERSEGD